MSKGEKEAIEFRVRHICGWIHLSRSADSVRRAMAQKFRKASAEERAYAADYAVTHHAKLRRDAAEMGFNF